MFKWYLICCLAVAGLLVVQDESASPQRKVEKQIQRLVGEWHFTAKSGLKPSSEIFVIKKDGTFSRQIHAGGASGLKGTYEVKDNGMVMFSVTHWVKSNETTALKEPRVFNLRVGTDLAGNLMILDETEHPVLRQLTPEDKKFGARGRVKVFLDDVSDIDWPSTYFRQPYMNEDQILFERLLKSAESTQMPLRKGG